MSFPADRPNSAVIVVDVQNGVVADVYQRDAVVAAIGRLVDKARAARVPVVWVQDIGEDRVPGTEPWQIVPELVPADDEPRLAKRHGDSFEDTELEQTLARLQVGRLFVAGAQTDACIRSTLHGAFVRGYDTILVADAHTTEDYTQWGAPSPEAVIRHTNLYWEYTTAPGRSAGTLTTDGLSFTR
ncbi:isochorismatase family protein [Nocardia sp. CDC159]|uniref:Isochorismatase family protein n=1 Tax=Nocardia pulmonis TaxID=2951408 RepID=A0A9X2IXQ3_9NOCA|nr:MULTISPECIES: isochorismatase family protein [Nocardia]MCM6773081.1 isochorismatase family protein [Nocardia pulmonis]MCM6785616.1 isochorismatase family protein [Nocardia sp. CDC159]